MSAAKSSVDHRRNECVYTRAELLAHSGLCAGAPNLEPSDDDARIVLPATLVMPSKQAPQSAEEPERQTRGLPTRSEIENAPCLLGNVSATAKGAVKDINFIKETPTPLLKVSQNLVPQHQVMVSGLPSAMVNEACLSVMLEHAQVASGVEGMRIRANGEVIITFKSLRLSGKCIQHFHGRSWAGSEVTAVAVRTAKKSKVKGSPVSAAISGDEVKQMRAKLTQEIADELKGSPASAVISGNEVSQMRAKLTQEITDKLDAEKQEMRRKMEVEMRAAIEKEMRFNAHRENLASTSNFSSDAKAFVPAAKLSANAPEFVPSSVLN